MNFEKLNELKGVLSAVEFDAALSKLVGEHMAKTLVADVPEKKSKPKPKPPVDKKE